MEVARTSRMPRYLASAGLRGRLRETVKPPEEGQLRGLLRGTGTWASERRRASALPGPVTGQARTRIPPMRALTRRTIASLLDPADAPAVPHRSGLRDEDQAGDGK